VQPDAASIWGWQVTQTEMSSREPAKVALNVSFPPRSWVVEGETKVRATATADAQKLGS
jgi:hypothetical protein